MKTDLFTYLHNLLASWVGRANRRAKEEELNRQIQEGLREAQARRAMRHLPYKKIPHESLRPD